VVLCIDTSGFSSFMRGDQKTVAVLEAAESVAVPAIVLGELYAGFALGTRQSENTSRLNSFLGRSGTYIQQIDDSIARRYGELIKILRTQGTPIPMNDIWIAATAIDLGATLLAFDDHFSKIPLLPVVP